jgi:glucosamine--fructose-6-phosphate aminotransferase (isomerizing)
MPTSEVYGFVEETSSFLKMDGEKQVQGVHGKTQGQLFELNQDSSGALEGIRAWYYDGTPLELSQDDIKTTDITSRDIDRQHYSHYLLKELYEAPTSVEKTLLNRWNIQDAHERQYAVVSLDETTVPSSLRNALLEKRIKRICFVAQGTAGVAGLTCAHILKEYLGDVDFTISAYKASEFSGFMMHADDRENSLADTLVIAITQSGTTTDTNRTVDMAKARGAYTLAIVNRRDSDITFKVDGVMYTSSGRDVEMSVASTKAFYSQVVAGAILGLYFASLIEKRDEEFVNNEIRQLLLLPKYMRTVLGQEKKIKRSARRLATTRTYWATVGSGPNKASADEIRIKLSELCYKTISSDFVEDKKHIDLSSEPLILICAAGTKEEVLADIIKDTAIFKAHKAAPVVIVNEGENRFAPYAEDVFYVPAVSQHLAPILNTLVGHLWGYHAALAINKGSHFLFNFREEIRHDIDAYVQQGFDLYEIFLEKSFREKIVRFYHKFRKKQRTQKLPSIMGLKAVSDLTLLFKYLSGRLPVEDFEVDFGLKGTPANIIETFFHLVGESIDTMARPVDAIKHQAKTVTVGTSRIPQKMEGVIFDALKTHNITIDQITSKNVLVLRNLQDIIADILGVTFYKVGNLDPLGEPTEDSLIEVVRKEGTSKVIESRAESDPHLMGIKRIIVRQGNVYIGKGRKDERSILVIPILSSSSATANLIEYLLLLNVALKENVSLAVKIRALGGKYEHIKNIVQENNVAWQDAYLNLMEMDSLFGKSAEKIAEFVIGHLI